MSYSTGDEAATLVASLAPEISGKRFELLKEILPKTSRVAVLGTSTCRMHQGYERLKVTMILRLHSEPQAVR
jgi:hypothetical protein